MLHIFPKFDCFGKNGTSFHVFAHWVCVTLLLQDEAATVRLAVVVILECVTPSSNIIEESRASDLISTSTVTQREPCCRISVSKQIAANIAKMTWLNGVSLCRKCQISGNGMIVVKQTP